jgi:hypothetical protein
MTDKTEGEGLVGRLKAGYLSLKLCQGLSPKFGGYNTLAEAATRIQQDATRIAGLERDLNAWREQATKNEQARWEWEQRQTRHKRKALGELPLRDDGGG